ncbi:RDD family protein [Treponema sp. R6D11]
MNQKRIIAWIIDFVITCIIQAILMALFLIKPIMDGIITSDVFNIMVRQLTITYCSMCYMIIRDIIGKRSVGKIIMKLKIVNKDNGNEANFVKRFFRNITWLLGPIEIIYFLVTKERIGDKITRTKIIEK